MKKYVIVGILSLIAIYAIYGLKGNSVANAERVTDDAVESEVIVPQIQDSTPTTAIKQTAPKAPFSEAAMRKVSTLKEILKSKNDNDPRMDTELKNLSNEDKDALVSMYSELKPESLNDKGTIVFLVGRDLTRPEDAEFLKNVLSEQPCLSLDNCGVTNAERDPHMDSINDTTLNYPQVVALNRIKTFIQTQDLQTVNPSILSHLTDAAQIGQNSHVSIIQHRAQEISALLSKKK